MYGKKVKLRILFLFLLTSGKTLISDGERKYTTFSSNDFKNKYTNKIIVANNKNRNNILNLTFLPYIGLRS